MNSYRRVLLKTALATAALPIIQLDVYAAGHRTDNATELVIPLWPENHMPDGPGPSGPETTNSKGSVKNVSVPRLVVYPAQRPNGAAMMVSGGGGYAHIERGTESTPACRWLQSVGVTAFELIYRLPEEGWARRDVPLQDGQRAMRIIRSLAHKMQYRADAIGVMGFSAGGHLSGMTETTPGTARYQPFDKIDAISSRPDYAALLYPVLTLVPPYDHTHTRRSIVGDHPSEARMRGLSADLQVTSETPPTFLAQAKDDPISPVENSERMYAALQREQVQSELLLFDKGGHGWGLGKPGSEETVWPDRFLAWINRERLWTKA